MDDTTFTLATTTILLFASFIFIIGNVIYLYYEDLKRLLK